MTAEELYNTLISQFNVSEKCLCDLHKPCNTQGKRRCTSIFVHKVIDFDIVKDEYCKFKGLSSISSVDAYSFKNHIFCFVEIKGWLDFIRFNINCSNLDSAILEQANKYDLEKKLFDSLILCQDISNDNTLFNNANIAFVLVTDIDVNEYGVEELFYNLLNLSSTSSSLLRICNDALRNKLTQLPSGINTYYIKCQQYDDLIESL